MKILSVETSCDETAIAIIDATGNPLKNERVFFNVFANLILSQIKIHKKYGGVFPSLAKREHSRNLIPLLRATLEEANFLNAKSKAKNAKLQLTIQNKIKEILEREPELLKQFLEFVPIIEKPGIDAIAVTHGPGLEPALWVGINFAKALNIIWDIPIIPVNHMEGHLFSALLKAEKRIFNFQFSIFKQKPKSKYQISNIRFPALALLISGGHTELVLVKNWLEYEIIGETLDDAAGEAFDKVARMLELPYPGGPAISRRAEKWKTKLENSNLQKNSPPKAACPSFGGDQPWAEKLKIRLPRPMLHSGDFNFSFSGLKTAVLYTLKKIPRLSEDVRAEIAYEFQESVAEVLAAKTIDAAKKHNVKTILVGGGVSANTRIQEKLLQVKTASVPENILYVAPRELTGDNALMIAVAGYIRTFSNMSFQKPELIRAEGSVRITS